MMSFTFPRTIVQNKVRIPEEIRKLLNLRNGDQVIFLVEKDGSEFKVSFKKNPRLGTRIMEISKGGSK